MARRGHEGLQELTPQSFQIITPMPKQKSEQEQKERDEENARRRAKGLLPKEDSPPQRYVEMTHLEVKKKHQGDKTSCSRAAEHPESQNRMVEQPGCKECPVKSMELSRIWPTTNKGQEIGFFQRPKKKTDILPDLGEKRPWYNRISVSKNPIGNFLKDISVRAGCEYEYTNHRIRNTAATALHKAGMSLHQIAKVTDHSNYNSLKSYLEELDDKEKIEPSDIMFDYGHQDPETETEPNEKEITRKPSEFKSRPVEAPLKPAFLKKNREEKLLNSSGYS